MRGKRLRGCSKFVGLRIFHRWRWGWRQVAPRFQNNHPRQREVSLIIRIAASEARAASNLLGAAQKRMGRADPVARGRVSQ